MSDDVAVVIAAVAVLVIAIVALKLLGNVFKAVVVSAIAAASLYAVLPQVATQQGAVGDVARKAQEATEDLDGTLTGLGHKANEVVLTVEDHIKQFQDAAEATERIRDTVESVAPPSASLRD